MDIRLSGNSQIIFSKNYIFVLPLKRRQTGRYNFTEPNITYLNVLNHANPKYFHFDKEMQQILTFEKLETRKCEK